MEGRTAAVRRLVRSHRARDEVFTSAHVTKSEAVSPGPRVSIVINNYNYARYLGDAIDSALAQTYSMTEVLVVDDGSTDESRQVIERYGGSVRPVLRANGGQASAINAGLQLVTGEIVLVLDSDDTLEPTVVERVVAEFARDTRCVRVQFRLLLRFDDGPPTTRCWPPPKWPLRTGDLSRHVMRYRTFRSPPSSGNAWSVRALRALPPIPEQTFHIYADRYFSELTALIGTIRALDEPGGTYRVHGTNHQARAGRGADYFTTRIELTRTLHRIGREVAGQHGLTGYPEHVDTPLDAAYLSWRLVAAKLADDESRTARWKLGARAAHASVRQPEAPLLTRAVRLAWVLAVAIAPAGTPLLERVIAIRFERGPHFE